MLKINTLKYCYKNMKIGEVFVNHEIAYQIE